MPLGGEGFLHQMAIVSNVKADLKITKWTLIP